MRILIDKPLCLVQSTGGEGEPPILFPPIIAFRHEKIHLHNLTAFRM